MNLHRRLERFPKLDIELPERHEILLLATVLIVGLTFVAPALSLVSGLPALVFVALVGVLYGILLILLRRMVEGSLVGLLVTSTFSANVPLTGDMFLTFYPGHLDPGLWLAQIPLVASIVLVLLTEPREMLAKATKTESLFAAFVGWTVLAAVFGATVRIDTALFFSLLLFQGLLVFVLLRYAVQREILSFELVARVFVGIVLAQSLFAVGQFLNGDVFGVTSLGEGDGIALATVSLGPLGDFAIGTHVAGFTGMSFILASLIVLAVPITIVFAMRESSWRRAALLGAALVMIGVLRATATDAGRGGLIVTLVCLCAALIYSKQTALLDLIRSSSSQIKKDEHARNAISAALTILTSIVVLLYPSSDTGKGSYITDINNKSPTNGGGGGTGAVNTQPQAIESLLQNLTIPFFDISTLGGRLQQYAVGIDLFLQYPIFGIGGANFIYYSTEYGLPRPLPLHSTYFAMLAETGLPGFVLFVALLGSVLWYGWKVTKQSNNGLLLVGLLCGMVGWLAFAFWSIPSIKLTPMFPFWILAGAMIGEYTRTQSP